MKITVNNEENPNKKREYPYLGELTNSDGDYFLVFFTSPASGICLKTTCMEVTVGVYKSNGWAEERYTLFKGEVILSN